MIPFANPICATVCAVPWAFGLNHSPDRVRNGAQPLAHKGADVTINEFAKTLGVSPTTVSRAMTGRGRLSPATRSMVVERMKELGFTPNVNAQRLSHGRTNMIALDFGHWHHYLADMFF